MFFKRIVSGMGNIFSNILRWTHYSDIVHSPFQLLRSVSAVFRVRTWHAKADFDCMVNQFHLTEADLIRRAQYFQRLIWFWLFVFSVVCTYGVYLTVQGIWLGVISTGILATIILLQAFCYHFWLFQIKQRKLGCSLQEWFQAFVQGK